MEQFTEPVEGQNEGQETAATFGGLRVSDCVVCARRQQYFSGGAGANFHCARTTIVWRRKTDETNSCSAFACSYGFRL